MQEEQHEATPTRCDGEIVDSGAVPTAKEPGASLRASATWAALYPGKEPRSTREGKVKSAHRGDLVLDKAPRHLASRPPTSDLPLLTPALLPNHLLEQLGSITRFLDQGSKPSAPFV